MTARSYSRQARDTFPGYAVPGAPCDVPNCRGTVAGSRTITLVAEHRTDDLSVLVRLCPAHVRQPWDQLLPLLPALQRLIDEAGSPQHFGTTEAQS